jgi:hypothetical protein
MRTRTHTRANLCWFYGAGLLHPDSFWPLGAAADGIEEVS